MTKFCILCKKKSITGDTSRSFHRFPACIDLREEWMKCCGLKSIAKTACICSDHFHFTAFNDEPGERKRLKVNAVPFYTNGYNLLNNFSDNSEYDSANSMMNESASEISAESEKPVQDNVEVKFPPFPDPNDNDFDDDITEEERNHYKDKFKDLNTIKTQRLHCSACDRHLGCAARNENRMRSHPMLRTLVCHSCHTFYNSGEFEKGDDGSELYCRWCGQGGQVYCCSDCPHVFCARCIRRNLGTPKIKEIEQADDWKCFKCNPKCLWDLRAICWAVLRYCDQKNKIAYNTQDPELKDVYQKDCALDYSECCKNKIKKKERLDSIKKKDSEVLTKKSTASIISKISPAIQVKKFASINPDDKPEKKAQKRPASPSLKSKPIFLKNPIALSGPNVLNPVSLSNAQPKKIRMTPPPIMNAIRFGNERKPNSLPIPRFRPKPQGIPILPHQQYNGFNNSSPGFNNLNPGFNNLNPGFSNSNTGFNNSNPFSNMVANDNINLSLDNLTQGLDMAAVAAMSSNNTLDDDVVCTPDLPLEPLCEVMEDNVDDDVQCITPGPVAAPKVNSVPPVAARISNTLPDLTPDNIVQMTENDVTVNAATGGLKFRVDPQTLSSNKMYRLPDGRIFAINANPTMPGGYSATIVAVTENTQGKTAPKGATYAAKLSAVTLPRSSSPPPLRTYTNKGKYTSSKRSAQNTAKFNRGTEKRECDLNVPVEWYRYNLIDAVDALEYSLSRLHKLKKEATTMFLRTRSINEMRNLHKTLDRLLNTSVSRFNEVRENINKEMKQYIAKKMGIANNTSEEDDDVEILPDLEDNDDPIFIDENSVESNVQENQEVDLTGVTSVHNISSDKSIDKHDSASNNATDCHNMVTDEVNNVSTDEINNVSTDEINNVSSDEINNVSTGVTISNFSAFNEDLKRQNIDKGEENEESKNELDTNVNEPECPTKIKEVKGNSEVPSTHEDDNNKDKEDDDINESVNQIHCDGTVQDSKASEIVEALEKNNSDDSLKNTEDLKTAAVIEKLDDS
ncbi:unnamed protein product [Parnassius apollo]|uniref:(apollo) hypothetical protein n=1 Tax=Parnassius apollo TaxID=110799 RepID=A0A8S3WK68_PARAO|nr:unnamed protein product [Parnassius apollo]